MYKKGLSTEVDQSKETSATECDCAFVCVCIFNGRLALSSAVCPTADWLYIALSPEHRYIFTNSLSHKALTWWALINPSARSTVLLYGVQYESVLGVDVLFADRAALGVRQQPLPCALLIVAAQVEVEIESKV